MHTMVSGLPICFPVSTTQATGVTSSLAWCFLLQISRLIGLSKGNFTPKSDDTTPKTIISKSRTISK